MSSVTGAFQVLGQKLSKTNILGERKELEE